MSKDKSISLRIPSKLYDLVKAIAGKDRSLSDTVQGMVEEQIARPAKTVRQEAATLKSDRAHTFGNILSKYYSDPGLISCADVLFMAYEIQSAAYCTQFALSEEMYRDAASALGQIYSLVASNGVARGTIDYHYIINKLPSDSGFSADKSQDSVVRELIDYNINVVSSERWRDNCVDDLFRCFTTILEDADTVNEYELRSKLQPYLGTLLSLSAAAVASKVPIQMPQNLSHLLMPHSVSKDFGPLTCMVTMTNNDFFVVVEVRSNSDACGVVMPMGFEALPALMDDKRPTIREGEVSVPLKGGIRLHMGVDTMRDLSEFLSSVVNDPKYKASYKLMSLVRGVII